MPPVCDENKKAAGFARQPFLWAFGLSFSRENYLFLLSNSFIKDISFSTFSTVVAL